MLSRRTAGKGDWESLHDGNVEGAQSTYDTHGVLGPRFEIFIDRHRKASSFRKGALHCKNVNILNRPMTLTNT